MFLKSASKSNQIFVFFFAYGFLKLISDLKIHLVKF